MCACLFPSVVNVCCEFVSVYARVYVCVAEETWTVPIPMTLRMVSPRPPILPPKYLGMGQLRGMHYISARLESMLHAINVVSPLSNNLRESSADTPSNFAG